MLPRQHAIELTVNSMALQSVRNRRLTLLTGRVDGYSQWSDFSPE